MIADAAPQQHAKAARWPQFTMHWGKAMAVALGAPALVTLLAFTSVRTVVPGLLYVVAIILATFVGGRIGGLVAVAASVFPFFHFFANRYDRNQINAEGATALVVFVVAALFGSEVHRARAGGTRASRARRAGERARARRGDAAAARRGRPLHRPHAAGSPRCRAHGKRARSGGARRADRDAERRRRVARGDRLARLRPAVHRAVPALPGQRELSALGGGADRRGRLHPLRSGAGRALPGAGRPLAAGARARVRAARG